MNYVIIHTYTTLVIVYYIFVNHLMKINFINSQNL
jgi:hypothetical protein